MNSECVWKNFEITLQIYNDVILVLLYPRYEVYRGHIVFAFSVIMYVCLSVCLSVCL